MEELGKAVKFFITRDIVFVIGGASVLITLAYLNGFSAIVWDLPASMIIFGAGIAHVIGFAMQSISNLLGISDVTANKNTTGQRVKLYELFARTKVKPIVDSSELRFAQLNDERAQAELDRIVFLKQIGATMAPCLLFNGVAFTLASGCKNIFSILTCGFPRLDLGIGCLFFSFVFVLINIVMSITQAQYVNTKVLDSERPPSPLTSI